MPTAPITNTIRWFRVHEGPYEIRGRLAPGEPWTFVWQGRADAEQLADFIFSIPLDSSVKATAWKPDRMLEVDEVKSKDDLQRQLKDAAESLGKGARFIRFETAPNGSGLGANESKVVAWSKQGPTIPGERIGNGAAGVGVYLAESKMWKAQQQLVRFVQQTISGAKLSEGTINLLLTKLAKAMTFNRNSLDSIPSPSSIESPKPSEWGA